ncbi:MAG: serine hydrolase [Xenococcaceae cyanobacterium]
MDRRSKNNVSRSQQLNKKTNNRVKSSESKTSSKPTRNTRSNAPGKKKNNSVRKDRHKINLSLWFRSLLNTIAIGNRTKNRQEVKSESDLVIPAWLTTTLTLMNVPIALLGVSAIAGTMGAIVNFSSVSSTNGDRNESAQVSKAFNGEEQKELEKLQRDNFIPETLQKQELLLLKQQLQAIAVKYPEIKGSVFCVELDKGLFVNWEGDAPFASASTIKLPILLALFQDIDAGKVRLDERLTIKPELIASGSGSIQYEKPGREYTILEIATKMIAISDNTATNVLIERLGGASALNQRFVEWGLQSTVIRNILPDLEGTNTTTARDLSNVLLTIEHGKSVSLKSRDRMLLILKQTTTNTLLPPGLEKGSIIFHKTGDIGTVLGDTGIVDMLNGNRYVITVLAKRPHNSPKGKFFIQEISKAVYEQFKLSAPNPVLQEQKDNLPTNTESQPENLSR